MNSPQSDPRILGYLGRALSLELSAVQQYTTQARLAAAWGLARPAERLRTEAMEEMGHVERVIARMLALGAAPNASVLRPVGLGRDLRELLQQDRALEGELVRLYTDATRYCVSGGDHDGRLFFETLLEEEREHGRELDRWLDSLQRPEAVAAQPERATF